MNANSGTRTGALIGMAVAAALVACNGGAPGSGPAGASGGTLPAVHSYRLDRDVVISTKASARTVGIELPSEGLGSVTDPKWKAVVGGYTQSRYSQVLAFPPGVTITIRNLSTSQPHTLDVVAIAKRPPARFPLHPTLSLKARGKGRLGPGYASGIIAPGKSVSVRLAKPGIYLIGCAIHYALGMRDVLVVEKAAKPGPQATPTPSASPSPSPSGSASPTASPSPTPSPTPYHSPTPSPTPYHSPTPSPTPYHSPTPSPAPYHSPTPSPTPSPTAAPTGTIILGIPSDTIGYENDPTWGQVAGFTQSKGSQVLAFPVGTVVTIKNPSKWGYPHTLDVISVGATPPPTWPLNPPLSTNPSGGSVLASGYASGTLTNQSVQVTLSNPGTYLIGCAYHYSEQSMRDVLIVSNTATPGPTASPGTGGY